MNELTELGNVSCDMLSDLYSFNNLLHSLRMCSDMTGMFITFALDLSLLH